MSISEMQCACIMLHNRNQNTHSSTSSGIWWVSCRWRSAHSGLVALSRHNAVLSHDVLMSGLCLIKITITTSIFSPIINLFVGYEREYLPLALHPVNVSYKLFCCAKQSPWNCELVYFEVLNCLTVCRGNCHHRCIAHIDLISSLRMKNSSILDTVSPGRTVWD